MGDVWRALSREKWRDPTLGFQRITLTVVGAGVKSGDWSEALAVVQVGAVGHQVGARGGTQLPEGRQVVIILAYLALPGSWHLVDAQ